MGFGFKLDTFRGRPFDTRKTDIPISVSVRVCSTLLHVSTFICRTYQI